MKKLAITLVTLMIGVFSGFSQNPNDFTVTGYVTDANGNAIAGQEVCVVSDSTNGFVFYECDSTNANGYYHISIPNGSTSGPNINYHVYTHDCDNSFLDTTVSNMQGTVDQANVDFQLCSNSGSNCQASFDSYPDTVQLFGYYFLNTSNGGLNYHWDFGDGHTSTQEHPHHIYSSAGIYPVCLTITDQNQNCADTYCDSIVVDSTYNVPCNASFTYSQTPNGAYAFDGHSDIPGVSYHWSFGDGTGHATEDPTHVFQPGTYEVCLTIYNNANTCYDTHCDTITVSNSNGNNCQANFTMQVDSSGSGSNTVHFHDISSGNPNFWEWDFGDGHTSYQQNPVHTYSNAGTYIVCLTTWNADSCSSTQCLNVTVGGNNTNCNGDFSYVVDSTNTNGVYFHPDANNQNYSYHWEFGDGTSGTGWGTYHTYNAPGTYQVCLTVVDFSSNCYDQVCHNVYIDTIPGGGPGCQGSFTYNVNPNGGVSFHGTSNVNNVTYEWYVDNSYSGTGQNPTFNLGNGTHYVCLTIYNNNGCQDNYCDTVVVGGNNQNLCISGHVSAGTPNYPADHGLVYLITFDSQTNMLTAIDTTHIDSSGFYAFCGVAPGTYRVKAALTPNSVYYAGFLPTYYGNSLFWDYAQEINATSSVSGVNITLIAGNNPGGPGFIGGDVTQGANKTGGPGDPVAGVQVMLLNMDDTPVAYGYSNGQGEFSFGNVAYGTYKVHAEMIGRTSYPAIVTIGPGNETVNNISFTVNETEVTTSVEPVGSVAEFSIGEVYPNPVAGQAQIEVTFDRTTEAVLRIFSLNGQVAHEQMLNISAGTSRIELPVQELDKGVYLLRMTNVEGAFDVSRKLIKIE